MNENIRFYPINYTMSSNMKTFFTSITESTELQKRLYNTDTILQVSDIAKELGHEVSPTEIMKAQAGRVLAIINEKNIDDIDILISGGKPKTGVQWGRGGNGFLDKAGYWLITLRTESLTHPENKQVDTMFTQIYNKNEIPEKILSAKTIADITDILDEYAISIDAIDLLAYQASMILLLDEETTLKVAS
jgi:hypothetical protein